MSELTNNSENCIKEIIFSAIDEIKSSEIITLSDLYIDLNLDDLTLSVYDDEDNMLAQGVVDFLNSLKDDPDTFEKNVIAELKASLQQNDIKSAIEELDVIKPFSIMLTGEDFDQNTELLRIDDDIIVLEDDYLKNLDKELDDFLKNLLSDI